MILVASTGLRRLKQEHRRRQREHRCRRFRRLLPMSVVRSYEGVRAIVTNRHSVSRRFLAMKNPIFKIIQTKFVDH